MKIRNFIIKSIAIACAFVAVSAISSASVKADAYDCYAGNHAYVRDYTSIQPTCEKPGCNVYYCITCLKGTVKYDIPALGHKADKGNIIVMPTATTNGWLVYRCVNCGMYMGDQVLPATSAPLPVTVHTPAPSIFEPFVKNPLEAVPMYFDTNMLAVCYIPYHSIVAVNGVGINADAIGAQPLAPWLAAPGKYVITVTPNTDPIHAQQNARAFTVTIPKDPKNPVTVK